MNDKKRIIYNNDGTFLLSNTIHDGRPISRQDVRDYVDLMAGTPVTSYFMCTCGSTPYYQNRHDRYIGSADGSKYLEGKTSPHTGENAAALVKYKDAVDRLQAEGTNAISLIFERCREVGLETFTSMRMNDLHFADRAVICPQVQPEFWLDHPEYDIGPDATPGWHSAGAFNFEHAAVRKYKLNLLEEMIERFQPDGHEMDLMRFPVYFPASKARACCPIMTEFIRKNRAIVKNTAGASGRERLFGVRLPASLDACKNMGCDPKVWVEEGLVDFITVSAFFFDVPALPLAKFREDIGSPDIPIYAGVDHGVGVPRGGWGHFRAVAANRWRENPDGLYFFNFFYHSLEGINPFALAAYFPPSALTRHGLSRELLCELSDPARLQGRNKIYNAGNQNNAYGVDITFDLPAGSTVKNGAIEFRLPMAEGTSLPKEVTLFLRATGEGKDYRVFFNGHPCMLSTTDANLYRLSEQCSEDRSVAAFTVVPSSIKDGDNLVRVECPGLDRFYLERADCVVTHGPVETHGYF